MIRKIKRFIRDPYWEFGKFIFKRCPSCMSDRWFINVKWLMCMGYKLDLSNPKTFNEKLQWLKLYDRNPLYTVLVDKYRAKQYVAEKIGDKYVVPTFAVYSSVDEIDIDSLPNQFVLKCNHDSGSFIICKNKNEFDIDSAKKTLNKCLNHNFYKDSREWPYKDVKRCILAEQYLEDNTFEDLVNYKFICINGTPVIMYITVKTDDIWENFYDMNFRPIEFSHGYRRYEKDIIKPSLFDELKMVAQTLAKDLSVVRVDFYIINNKIFFSEYTFYDWGGFAPIQPFQWDIKLGEMINV